MTKFTNDFLLGELNAFRAAEGKAPFADWRKARHMPMLEAYRVAEQAEELPEDAPDALLIDPATGEMQRESEVEEITPVEKPEAYKVLARMSGSKSTIEKPVDFTHSFLTAHPDLTRKEAVAALVKQGVNYSTARTQYQKWFSARKG